MPRNTKNRKHRLAAAEPERSEAPPIRRLRPRDGRVIEFWTVDLLSVQPVQHRRATYYESTAWRDHPWSQRGGTHGVAFVKDWALEVEGEGGLWLPVGRGDTDWLERHLALGTVLRSHAAALDKARDLADQQADQARIRLAEALELRKRLG